MRKTPNGRAVLVLFTAAAALAAGTGGAGAMGVPRPTPVERLMESRLTVTYAADGPRGATAPRTYTVECGTEQAPDGDPACERLVEIGGPAGAVPAGQMCSMIYGGPQTAHVTGRWHGRLVNEDYRRTNGCEVARWDRMIPVLPAVNRANATTGATGAAGPGTAGPATGVRPVR
ncbi:SSI family serine proteinase inhibitor [Actinacidiphila alni]|uniref:SSI family serine proteinase inhibitor n=1 Tax=Actinacidiphila alni TaxID=380248 RepID=UPI0033C96693